MALALAESLIRHGTFHAEDDRKRFVKWSETAADIGTLHDADYWRRILSAAPEAEILRLEAMESFQEC